MSGPEQWLAWLAWLASQNQPGPAPNGANAPYACECDPNAEYVRATANMSDADAARYRGTSSIDWRRLYPYDDSVF